MEKRGGISEMLRQKIGRMDDERESRKWNDFQISVLGDWVSLNKKGNIIWQITCFRSI